LPRRASDSRRGQSKATDGLTVLSLMACPDYDLDQGKLREGKKSLDGSAYQRNSAHGPILFRRTATGAHSATTRNNKCGNPNHLFVLKHEIRERRVDRKAIIPTGAAPEAS
jgi:hypothetical protein